MSSDGVNKERRRFLIATTSVVGAVGAGFAAVPFIKSWNPSAKAQAVGAPVEVNVAKLEQGQLLKVQWRGQTIGVLRRTPRMLEDLGQVAPDLRDPDSAESNQPEYAANDNRALRPEFLVVNMHCTHLGCVPQMIPEVGPQPFEENWKGGFYCPCHKSKFDNAGRVYKAVPAPTNLTVPPYSYLDEDTLIIGVNPEGVV
jgi:ubiquinol-cytochrome c reductase iron-sulfur subunit